MDEYASELINPTTIKITRNKHLVDTRHTSGTPKEQNMAPICMESEWHNRLNAHNWDKSAVSRIHLCWATSTLNCFNSVLQKFQEFCVKSGVCFPPKSTAILAMYLCPISDRSERPKASLNTTVAAVNALHKVGACAIYCDFWYT